MSDKVKVAVRVRPFNRREIELGTQCVVEMTDKQTILNHPSSTKGEHCRKQPKTFAFDSCLWSFNEKDDHYASQETVYRELGGDILQNAFEGYNACIFAYGQTGSGKSFSMMGSEDNKGLIPRLCDALFERIASNQDPSSTYKVEVSYMEIYNERVHDLLDPKGNKQNLRVREHNILGPYVDGLSTLAVSSYEAIDNLMGEGNKSRTVAATNMNSESSRSHAVFNIILTCSITDLQSGVTGEKASKMSLVDLAGSERAVKTGAVGERLKEGSNINKSLTTLGLVISKLADQSAGKSKDNRFVPYRDSVLTWLLKDNLGGNSRTVMVATISPAADNYEETLSTLRYADRAKRIVNHAVINEDPNARIIRELREEVEMLREQLKHAAQQDVLKERLVESEKLMQEMSQTWEEKLSKTEKIHHERQQALEKMGISVQASGIKVEQDKYYLVNLNADPSLNELLVYYLKDLTRVGRSGAPIEQDIQLSGLGIMPEHCLISIENSEIYIWPIEGARTCVNGSVIIDKNQLKHGDRVLWGNNHFFRVNCPKTSSPNASTPERPIDYEFAREELMMNELSNDPIQNAMKTLEKQHEEDKHNALEKQRQMYEKQLQMLRNQMSPSTPYAPYSMGTFDPLGIIGKNMTPTGLPSPSVQSRMDKWAKERDELFRKSLAKLRGDIVRANGLVREANFLSDEMGKRTEFKVTLQIPAANLSPNRKKGAFVSEPAILVKRKNKGSQVWSMEKLENKLIDMREMFEEQKDKSYNLGQEEPSPKALDPFYESQENHNLIGVANIFLEVLFHDVKLNYQVPIISQQGEVAGRLHVELCRVSGSIPERLDSSTIDVSEDSEDVAVGRQVKVRVAIKAAAGLPPSLSNFVFCQYSFWAYPDAVVVPPIVNPEYPPTRKGKENLTFKFDHVKEFTLNCNEEFIEHCAEGALSIEVWGHRSAGFSSAKPGWEIDAQFQRSRSLADRWAELTRKIELWVDILEINDNGEYAPVEVVSKPDTLTGGIYQLRQGQQRRVVVRVQPVSNSGTLPIICEAITSVAIGCICSRVKLQKALDSYQEEDLSLLREKWSEALMRRREYLDEQIQKMINKSDKSEEDTEREQSLIDQWVCLTEERNAVLVPAPKSGIPGAPADWEPQMGMEQHIPVIFLELNADDMGVPVGEENEGIHVAGTNSILPKEHGSKLYNLPILKHFEKDVCAVAAWDSSIHDSILLNRATPPNERVYLILKASIRLTHPATMDLILRKRLSINVYKKQSIAERIKKKIVWQDTLTSTGVTYEVVANIPKASEDPEDREALALMAASGEDSATSDGESYIEKYTRGVSAVESILTLDRLRQEVAVKELLAAHGRPLRKTASVPNIAQIMRMESSPSSKLDDHLRSDSVHDLSSVSFDSLERLRRGSNSLFEAAKSQVALLAKETRPTFLNLNFNLNLSLRQATMSKSSPLSSMSPANQPTKLVKPMRTLLEEINNCQVKPLLEKEESEESAAEDESFNKSTIISKNAPIESRADCSEEKDNDDDDDEFTDFESYRPTEPLNNATTILEKEPVEKIPPDNKSLSDMTMEEEEEELEQQQRETITGTDYETSGLMKHSGTCDSFLAYQTSNKVGTPSIVSSGYGGSQGMSATPSEDSYSLKSVGALLDVMTPEAIDPCRLHNYSMSSSSENILEKEAPSELPVSTTTSTIANPMTKSVESPITEAHSNDSIPEEIEDENEEEKKYTVELRQNRAAINQFVAHRASCPVVPTDKTSTSSSSFVKPRDEQVEMRARLGELNLLKIDVDQQPSDQSQPNNTEDDENNDENGSEKSHHGGEDAGTDQEDSTSVSSFGSKADLHSSVGDVSLPPWLVVGESVAISPYNKRGTVAYLGNTHFSPGIWAGIELDTPTGKNDGTVNGFRYFQCKPRFGIFVRPDKLQLDKRGREIRAARQSMPSGEGALRRSRSKGEGLSSSYIDLSGSRLSRSRGEGLSTLGLNSTMPRSRSRGEGLQSTKMSQSVHETSTSSSSSDGPIKRSQSRGNLTRK